MMAIAGAWRYAFVLTGGIRVNQAEHGALSFVDLSGVQMLAATEASRIIWLPERTGLAVA